MPWRCSGPVSAGGDRGSRVACDRCSAVRRRPAAKHTPTWFTHRLERTRRRRITPNLLRLSVRALSDTQQLQHVQQLSARIHESGKALCQCHVSHCQCHMRLSRQSQVLKSGRKSARLTSHDSVSTYFACYCRQRTLHVARVDVLAARLLFRHYVAMRLLFITLEYSCATFSGNGVYSQSQVRALRRAGHQVQVCMGCPSSCEYTGEASDVVVRFIRDIPTQALVYSALLEGPWHCALAYWSARRTAVPDELTNDRRAGEVLRIQ